MVSRSSRRFNAPPAAGPVLIVLLTGGCWLCGSRPAALGQAPAGARQAQPGAQPDYAHFEKLKKQADEHRKQADELYEKARAAAQPHIEEQVKVRGGGDQARRQLGLTLAELNARLQPGAPPLPPG